MIGHQILPDNFDNKVTYTAIGRVYSQSRVISISTRKSDKVECEFKFVFTELVPDSHIPVLNTASNLDKIQLRIKEAITLYEVYTDLDGEIQSFREPNGPWWIDVETIQVRHRKVDRSERSNPPAPPNGPDLEGELPPAA